MPETPQPKNTCKHNVHAYRATEIKLDLKNKEHHLKTSSTLIGMNRNTCNLQIEA